MFNKGVLNMSKYKINYYNNNFGIEYVYSDNSKFSYSEHSHVSVYTIIILLSGSLKLKKENQCFDIKEGEYIVIKPYEIHSISLNKSEYYQMLSVCINKNVIKKNDLDSIKYVIINDLNYLVNSYFIKFKYSNVILKALNDVYYIKEKIDKKISVGSILDIIEKNPEIELNIDEMCEKIYISKYHFIRKFKKEMGLTPHKFHIQNKIRKAKKMLNEGYSIIETAMYSGFYDESHLIRNFKNSINLTPSEYKKLYIKMYDEK